MYACNVSESIALVLKELQRRGSVTSPQTGAYSDLDDLVTFAFQLEYVGSMSPSGAEMVQLLVVMSGLLSSADLKKLSKPLWSIDLDSADNWLVVPVSFQTPILVAVSRSSVRIGVLHGNAMRREIRARVPKNSQK
jgi:hypothetical protein